MKDSNLFSSIDLVSSSVCLPPSYLRNLHSKGSHRFQLGGKVCLFVIFLHVHMYMHTVNSTIEAFQGLSLDMQISPTGNLADYV